MGPLALRLRAELRGKWRGWLGLAVLIGVFGGATLATTAASRRTSTAYDRFLAATHPYDQFVLGGDLGEIGADVTPEALRTIPQVDYVMESFFFASTSQEFIGSADPRFDRTFNRAIPVEGSAPVAANEVAAPVAIKNPTTGRSYEVGQTITADFLTAFRSGAPQETIRKQLVVTALIAAAGEFPPESDLGPPRIHLTRTFALENASKLAAFPYMLVWLKRGPADLPAFRKALTERFNGKPVIGFSQAALTNNVNRSFRLQAASLALFAAALAIVTMLVLGQALGRQALSEGVDYPALRALGVTRRQLFFLGAVRASLVGVSGVVLALPIAFLLSPFSPTGLARAAEPNSGFSLDATALGVGALLTTAVLLAFAFVPAVRAARAAARTELGDAASERGSRAAAAATRAGVAPSAVIGMRLALEPGRGRTAVPVRTTIVGVALAVAAVVLSLGFASSLQHLLHTPRLYGVVWSAIAQFDDDDTTNQRSAQALAIVRKDPDVAASGYSGLGIPLFVDGVQADSMMLPSDDATFNPPILEGRAPAGDGEIALGTKTLQLIHKRVGDTVGAGAVGVKPSPMRVVGRAVIPTVGHTANLGQGGWMTFESVHVFVPGANVDVLPRDEFLIRFRPGVDTKAARERLAKAIESTGAQISEGTVPADLLNFAGNQNLPYILSGILAALALATLGHAIFSGITRRRRDLAILKTLGFTRGDTRRAVAWQSTTLAIIAVALGIGVGAITGRWLWTVTVNSLGIIPEPRVPLILDLAIVPIGLVVANGLALLPARAAARTRPALVLRTE